MRAAFYTGTAIYTNTFTGATHQIGGVKDLAQAWRLANFVLSRTGWNQMDLKVKFKA